MLPHRRPAPRCGERAVVRAFAPLVHWPLPLAPPALHLCVRALVVAPLLWLLKYLVCSHKVKEGSLAAKYKKSLVLLLRSLFSPFPPLDVLPFACTSATPRAPTSCTCTTRPARPWSRGLPSRRGRSASAARCGTRRGGTPPTSLRELHHNPRHTMCEDWPKQALRFMRRLDFACRDVSM